MSRIFISYRRDDTAGYNLTLAEQLKKRFGQQQVFMDIDSIKPGVDFRTVIQEAVSSCDALIALIGKNWVTSTDESGRHRLDDPSDFVRLEIKAALDREDILVIPALVHGAPMPRPEDLPPDLEELAWRNAIELRDSSFGYDVGRLIESLAERLKRKDQRKDDRKSPLAALLERLRSRPKLSLGVPAAVLLLAAVVLVLRSIISPGSTPIPAPPAMGVVFPATAGTLALSDSLGKGSISPLSAKSNDPHAFHLSYSSGGLDMHVTDGRWFAKYGDLTDAVASSGVGSMSDGSIAVDVRLVGDAKNRNVSVRCRVPSSNVGGYVLWVRPAQQLFHLAREEKQTAALLQQGTSPVIHTTNWNRLQLSCIGSTITAAVNGVVVARAYDSSYRSGWMEVGVGEYAAVPSAEAVFANLQVTQTQVLLQDNFTNPATGSLLKATRDRRFFVGYLHNVYAIAAFDKRFLAKHDYIVYLTKAGTQTDTTLSVDARLVRNDPDQEIALRCRESYAESYVFWLEPTAQYFVLAENTSNGPRTLAHRHLAAIRTGTAWNHVDFQCNGDTMTARVNGVLAASVHDSSVPSGESSIGVGVFNSAVNPSEAYFSHLMLTTP